MDLEPTPEGSDQVGLRWATESFSKSIRTICCAAGFENHWIQVLENLEVI